MSKRKRAKPKMGSNNIVKVSETERLQESENPVHCEKQNKINFRKENDQTVINKSLIAQKNAKINKKKELQVINMTRNMLSHLSMK